MNQLRPIALAIALLLIGCALAGPARGAGRSSPDAERCAGIALGSLMIETMGLPSTARPECVLATPYDSASPPTPTGLPQHVEIDFGVTDPGSVQPGAPILYIIPVAAYEALWAHNGDPSVSRAIEQLRVLLASRPDPVPTSGMPVLPYERVTGVNDLAVQGRYLDTTLLSGVRFVSRFSQGPNPVTNVGLHYIFQGFSTDGRYLIAFFHSVATTSLPVSAAEVPSEELQRVDADPTAYLAEQAEQLNALTPDDWDPDLAVLDALVDSLRFELASACTSRQGESRRAGGESSGR